MAAHSGNAAYPLVFDEVLGKSSYRRTEKDARAALVVIRTVPVSAGRNQELNGSGCLSRLISRCTEGTALRPWIALLPLGEVAHLALKGRCRADMLLVPLGDDGKVRGINKRVGDIPEVFFGSDPFVTELFE